MNKIFFSVLCSIFVLFTYSILANNFSGDKLSVSYFQPNSGSLYYAFSSSIQIGQKYSSELQETEKARTKYSFDLTSIPSNATIDAVTLNGSVSNFDVNNAINYKIKITQASNLNAPNTLWPNIGDATDVFPGVDINYGYMWPNLSNSTLTSMVNSNKGGTMYLGALSLNEITSNSYANLDLTLSVFFTVPSANVSITADNNFTTSSGTHGEIIISGYSDNQTAPFTFSTTVGQSVSLTAVSPQTDNQNYQRIWHAGSTSPSGWLKEAQIIGSNQTHNFNVAQSDAGKTFQAQLRKNYQISRNDQTEFDGTISAGVATQIVEQNSGYITAPLQQTINNKTYQFAGWVTGESNNTLTITPTGNDTYTALYKYPNHTNQSTAFTNNNQRKVVFASAKFSVYESMGKIWVEKNDEEILNNGLPLNPSTEAKDPSITFSGQSGSERIYVTYQEKMPDNTYVIKLVKFSDYGNLLYSANVYKSSNTYDKKAEPVIAASYGGSPAKDKIMFVWKEAAINDTAGGFRAYGVFDEGNTYSTVESIIPDVLPFPQSGDINPTLDVIRNHGCVNPPSCTQVIHPHFQLAWQNNDRIYYRNIIWSTSGLNAVVPVELSTGSGYTYNRYPSIIARIDENNIQTARISWQGERYEEQEMRTEKIAGLSKTESRATPNKNVLFKSTDYYRFWAFGSRTSGKPSINQSEEGYIIGWSEDNGNQVKCVNNSLNQLKIKTVVDDNQIPLKGEGVQVLNGTFSNEDIKVISLNTEALPYRFQKSEWLDFSKANNRPINIAREGVVYNGDAQMYFSFGDVQLNGTNIDFIEIPEDVPVNSDSQLNKYMRTENFILNNESNFVYSVIYGITDSSAVAGYLNSGKEVNFKIVLTDAISEEVIGNFDEVNYNSGNIFQYNNLGYEVSGEGIGSRTVYLSLISSSNGDENYSLSQKFSDEIIFGKNNTKKINYTGTTKPTEYALYQNYPNPFNPVTTITYQIPKEGLVTLKIYDILGKEVTTLQNEEKQAGKYSIDFNASKLSSGVYLYELRSNDYKSTKKLLLMK